MLLAHSIKGSAGALGAITLQQLAGSLEEALCQNNMTATRSLFASFENEMIGLCDDLNDFLTSARSHNQTTSAGQPELRDLASARGLLKKLSTLLLAGDSDAEEIVAQLRPILGNLADAEEMDALETYVMDVEFEEALLIAGNIIERIGKAT